MNPNIRLATQADEAACNAIAMQSRYTKFFAKPGLSFLGKRAVAIQEGNVLVYTTAKGVLGFCWSYPHVAKHMPFSSVYAVGTVEFAKREGVASALIAAAAEVSPFRVVQLTCDLLNEAGYAFYMRLVEEGKANLLYKGAFKGSGLPYARFEIKAKP